jgi:CHAT domain-containing protein/tetratricopeptide (TPR) repeat protein
MAILHRRLTQDALKQRFEFLVAILLAAWFLVAGCNAALGASEEVWEDTIKEGLAAAKRQDLTAAVRAFERAVRDGQYIDSDRHVVSLNFLGDIYLRLGEFAKGEQALRRALRIIDNIPGITDHDRASTTNNLAAILDAQGRFREAENLYRRALELLLRSQHVPATEIYPLVSNLAGVEERLGNMRLAEWLYRFATGYEDSPQSAKEGALGPVQLLLQKVLRGVPPLETHIAALNNLGALLAREARLEEAEQALGQAQSLAASSEGMLLEAASAAHNRGLVLDRLGQSDLARTTLERAYSLRQQVLGSGHLDVASTRYALAQHLANRGDVNGALEHARAALAVLEPRITNASAFAGLSASSRIATVRQWREAFEAHLGILQRFREQAGAEWMSEAFRLIQLAKASETAMAIAGSVQRHAVDNPKLADSLRRHQDTLIQRQDAERRLANILALPPAQRESNTLTQARAEVDRVDQTLTELLRQLSTQENNEGTSVTLRATQLALQAGEAMLVYFLGSQSNHVAVITRADSNFVVLDTTRNEIARLVRRLRNHLDATGIGMAAAYPTDDAHRLYVQLLAPVEKLLGGAREIIVVADGELETLPFSVLLRHAAPASTRSDVMRGYPWLIRDYALTSLPSADALVRLRSSPRGPQSREAFIAFADPLLQGSGAGQRSKDLRQTTAIAKVDDLKQLSALPETADEVSAIAKLLGASASSLYLRDRATETQVKTLPLDRYRVVMFATHGVLSGDIPGILEPALVLSPPVQGSMQDDGVLTASEIGRLKLDADWVILSACNTAAGDGTPGNEGYSGLARAFFYAGARALLVSHWPVASEATVALTTKMFEALGKDAQISRAQALRQSMLEMIDRPEKPEFSHPLFWAPFVLVGNSIP